MCGIAVLLAYGASDLVHHIAAMTNAVRHRGPDDEGYALFSGPGLDAKTMGGDDTPRSVWSDSYAYAPHGRLEPKNADVAFGHRRLSIIDLSSSGHQPMCSADGRYWIVYNGEIYNYPELREQLAARGYPFISNCDTEVILAAWSLWGPTCLQHFNGMFAFALLDRANRTLYAVRDRFGVKPLYFWRMPSGALALASEIKQFTVLPGWVPKLEPQRTYDYLAWGLADHTGDTLFRDVRQLRGGEMLTLSLAKPGNAKVEPTRWYRLTPKPFGGSWAEGVELFRSVFTDAVRLRLRSDVAVGSCLSGGLDSSSIVCVASRLLGGPAENQKVFTAGSKVARFDETRYARAVIEATGAEAHFVDPDPAELFDKLDALTAIQDEPFGSSSIYAQWQVFGLARAASVKVVLDGQGADELLAGYAGFLRPLLLSLAFQGRMGEFTRAFRDAGRSPHFGYTYALQQLADGLLPPALRNRLRKAVGRPATGASWLDMARLGAFDREPLHDEYRNARTVATLSQLLLLSSGVPTLLHNEDRNSMAHSVESRVPFLDYRLVETVLGMPDQFKLSRGTTKIVLREAMRGVLPEMVRTRQDKLGFATAEPEWLRGSAKERFRRGIERCVEASNGIVRKDVLEQFDRIAAGKARFDFRMWRLLNFGVWLGCFGISVA